MIEWKPVKDYKGIYEVSSDGQIKSLERRIYYTLPSGKESSRLCRERILKPSNGGRGYALYHLCGEEQVSMYGHRIVAEAFLPNPDGKDQVNHINGDKTDNRAENLEWSTKLENRHHALANGLNRYGKRYEEYALTC